MRIPLQNKKDEALTKTFQNVSNHKPNKIWIGEGSEFYSRLLKTWLQHDIEICSTHNERKSGVFEKLIRTLKIKVYEYMAAILKKYILINFWK